jgi:hypothetical protein
VDLTSVFSHVAHKELVAVDLPHRGSNQHELNGVKALREFFRTEGRVQGTISWHYFADDAEPIQETTSFTFYDGREKDPNRSAEWRLYYPGNFLAHADVGDRLFLARSKSGALFGLVFQDGSAWLRAAAVLFGTDSNQRTLALVPHASLHSQELELLRRQILDELGLELVVPAVGSDSEIMVKKYGRTFPSTKEMAVFARSQVEVDPNHTDETLIRWLNREEELFRALEEVIIGERLQEGFKSVDDFIQYSLSVQNRRKSRMGFALQNHLSELFTFHRLRFKAQARTEGNNRPDFLFPGETEYRDQTFNPAQLIMLGVKSTSKDRWRQVLDEADRITNKHLCTLEPGISTKQTDAMRNRRLTLVVPSELHATYTEKQREEMMNIEAFIDFVVHKQTATN